MCVYVVHDVMCVHIFVGIDDTSVLCASVLVSAFALCVCVCVHARKKLMNFK